MPGSPPTSPRFGAPRTSDGDAASFSAQVEGVTDIFDSLAGYFYAPGTHATRIAIATPVDRSLYYETDTTTLWLYVNSAWRQLALSTQAIPIGGQIAYTGQNDLPGGLFVVADGRLIDSTTYAAFDATCGRTAGTGMLHAYNGGVDPGSNKVRIPDKRGKSSRGAVNMGTGAAANDNAHVQAVNGRSGGEVNHTQLAAESGQNSNAGMGTESADHAHSTSGTTSGESANHYHYTYLNMANTGNVAGGSAFTAAGAGLTPYQSTNDSNDHSHTWSGTSGGRSAAHTHAMSARNADSAHNTVDPYETDTILVRIA